METTNKQNRMTMAVLASAMAGMSAPASENVKSWQEIKCIKSGTADFYAQAKSATKARMGQNQRQKRKARRRAHAAGKRNAFA